VTRLKAMDLEVAAMGDVTPGLEDTDHEVVVVAEPSRHVYKKLVVKDGLLVGALLLGDLRTAGVVTQHFDRQTPLPADLVSLLVPARKAADAAPADDDTVCTCNSVSAGEIRDSGCHTVAEVALKTRATTGCGTCAAAVACLLTPREETRTVA
jgi:assimilatory nitrate reductase electron transfer subunit